MEQTTASGGEKGGLDLSALLAGLGGAGQGKAPGEEGGPDLSSLLGLLGGSGGGDGAPSGGGVDFASLLGMLGGLGGGSSPEEAPPEPPPPAPAAAPSRREEGGGLPFDPALLTTLSRAMAALREPDRNIRLLEALKPFLESERRKKVDEAVKILHLMRLAPLLQESGVLGKLMGEG